jgi:hypothetical protein
MEPGKDQGIEATLSALTGDGQDALRQRLIEAQRQVQPHGVTPTQAANKGTEQQAVQGVNPGVQPSVEPVKDEPPVFFKRKQQEQVSFNDLNEAISFLSEKTGMDMKSPSDLATLVDSYSSIKSERERLLNENNDILRFKQVFETMPDDLFNAVNLWASDKDYRDFLRAEISEKLDFSKPFHKQDKEAIVNFYYPGKFSKEELSEEGNQKVAFALEQAEAKYSKDQDELKNRPSYRDKYLEEERKYKEKLDSSRKKAEDYFNSLNVNLNDEQKKAVNDIIKGGQVSVLREFVNDDGTWKEDAYEKALYMKHAKEIIDTMEKFISRRVESKANEQFVQRGKDEPGKQRPGQQTSHSEDEVKAFVKNLIPGQGQQSNPFK